MMYTILKELQSLCLNANDYHNQGHDNAANMAGMDTDVKKKI